MVPGSSHVKGGFFQCLQLANQNDRSSQSKINYQRHAIKFVMGNFSSDYKLTPISLNILPLMYTYELADILFLVKQLQNPEPSFPIFKFINLASSFTRFFSSSKLKHLSPQTNLTHHFYFSRIIRLWNIQPSCCRPQHPLSNHQMSPPQGFLVSFPLKLQSIRSLLFSHPLSLY